MFKFEKVQKKQNKKTNPFAPLPFGPTPPSLPSHPSGPARLSPAAQPLSSSGPLTSAGPAPSPLFSFSVAASPGPHVSPLPFLLLSLPTGPACHNLPLPPVNPFPLLCVANGRADWPLSRLSRPSPSLSRTSRCIEARPLPLLNPPLVTSPQSSTPS
jgi:hypothetical protein